MSFINAAAARHPATSAPSTPTVGTPEYIAYISGLPGRLSSHSLYHKNSHIQELVQMLNDPFTTWMQECDAGEIKQRASANRLLYDWLIAQLGETAVRALRERRTALVADVPTLYA